MVVKLWPHRVAVPAGRVPTFAKVQINIIRTKYGLDTEQIRP